MHCYCVLTIILKYSVVLLELKHNGMSSIKNKEKKFVVKRR
jgi:hypothetical protein